LWLTERDLGVSPNFGVEPRDLGVSPNFGVEPVEPEILAERGGFEPPVDGKAYDGLANRCFRPLSHLSGS
jgi:hypothetical protein